MKKNMLFLLALCLGLSCFTKAQMTIDDSSKKIVSIETIGNITSVKSRNSHLELLKEKGIKYKFIKTIQDEILGELHVYKLIKSSKLKTALKIMGALTLVGAGVAVIAGIVAILKTECWHSCDEKDIEFFNDYNNLKKAAPNAFKWFFKWIDKLMKYDEKNNWFNRFFCRKLCRIFY
ncbi:MAG: hypothetical protein WC436_01650 [Candidatus Babeliales bacterium]